MSAPPAALSVRTADLSAEHAEARERQRFAVELEFVQSLANPDYLFWLHRAGYFDDPAFLRYLAYLRYWREPRYAVYLLFPMCLAVLELLQNPGFRAKLGTVDAIAELKRQQSHHWLYFGRSYENVQQLFQYQLG